MTLPLRKEIPFHLCMMCIASVMWFIGIWRRMNSEAGSLCAGCFQDYLPNGWLKVLDDCGHMMNMEQPEAFNEALEEFLRGK